MENLEKHIVRIIDNNSSELAVAEIMRLFAIVRSEHLVDFLLYLNDKELINNHDFDYEKEAINYLKKITNCH